MKLRLARLGSKKRPFYWIMASDARNKRTTGKEKLGTYNPLLAKDREDRVTLNVDRIQYWLGVGAQPTDVVERLLKVKGLLK